MCEFCGKIYGEEETPYDNCIFKDKNGFHIYAYTGDSWCCGIISNIEFCPYCGGKLNEREYV